MASRYATGSTVFFRFSFSFLSEDLPNENKSGLDTCLESADWFLPANSRKLKFRKEHSQGKQVFMEKSLK